MTFRERNSDLIILLETRHNLISEATARTTLLGGARSSIGATNYGQSGLFCGVQRGTPSPAPALAPHPDEMASGGKVAKLPAWSATQRGSATTVYAETGPPAAWHDVATRWERPAPTGPSCSTWESRQFSPRGTLAKVALLVSLRLVMLPRTRVCQIVRGRK